SRDNVAEYRSLRSAVEGHIGRINGKFTEPGWDVPIHYLHRALPPEQLVAYYAVADVMLITPLIDGMNLVANEYVTGHHARRGDGAMILSEFAGAASELRQAIPCNPFDVEGLSLRIEHALALSQSARRAAIATMARHVAAHDVHRWVAKQLGDIVSASSGRGRLDRQLGSAQPRYERERRQWWRRDRRAAGAARSSVPFRPRRHADRQRLPERDRLAERARQTRHRPVGVADPPADRHERRALRLGAAAGDRPVAVRRRDRVAAA